MNDCDLALTVSHDNIPVLLFPNFIFRITIAVFELENTINMFVKIKKYSIEFMSSEIEIVSIKLYF